MPNNTSPDIVTSDDNGWIGLSNIHFDNLPQTIIVDGNELSKKSEFHITLMAVEYLAPMLGIDDERARLLLRDDFLEFTKTHDITRFKPTESMIITRKERITVVAMVDMPELHTLFDFLRTKHGIAFPTQPAHITLYTLQPDAGIWLLSDEEVQRDGTPIAISELSGLFGRS